MLIDMKPAARQQLTLDLGSDIHENLTRLMQGMDEVNQRFRRGTLYLASVGTAGRHRASSMKQEWLSSGFTTDWVGLAVVGRGPQ
jgi:DNA polymerase V